MDSESTISSTQGAGGAGDEQPSTPPAGPADGATAAVRGRRRIGILLGIAVVAYVLDQGTKSIVVRTLEPENKVVNLIGDLLQLRVIRNGGAAFSIGQGMTIVFTVIACAVIVVIVRLARRLYSLPWAIALGLLLGGALGNLTDRVLRSPGGLQGHVVDFIAPAHYAIFNLADSAIVCGGILIVILAFKGSSPDGSVDTGKDSKDAKAVGTGKDGKAGDPDR